MLTRFLVSTTVLPTTRTTVAIPAIIITAQSTPILASKRLHVLNTTTATTPKAPKSSNYTPVTSNFSTRTSVFQTSRRSPTTSAPEPFDANDNIFVSSENETLVLVKDNDTKIDASQNKSNHALTQELMRKQLCKLSQRPKTSWGLIVPLLVVPVRECDVQGFFDIRYSNSFLHV